MLRKLFKKTICGNFVIIDSLFPQKNPFAFRNTEINEYLTRISNVDTYTMYPMVPGPDAWFTHGYGISQEEFYENMRGYQRHYPKECAKIHYLLKGEAYKFNLAYSYFLGETYVLLPFYEKQKIPFVFVLYPGGGFGLNNDKSDAMLRRIFGSKYFCGVIVTQQITKDYLINKRLCVADKIKFIYGGFVQFKKNEIKPKKLYMKDKSTFDICFVAAKYSEKGVDKGYDKFIETAKKLAAMRHDIRFHVIGGFDENDIDISDISQKITFYGYKRPDFLLNFYAKIDIFLAPNRPNKLYEGNFDGFPLGIDAAYCGVALFVADELDMNKQLYDRGTEIEIITFNTDEIVEKIMYYYNNLEALYDLSSKGQQTTHRLFDIDYQIDERIAFFRRFADLRDKLNNGNS